MQNFISDENLKYCQSLVKWGYFKDGPLYPGHIVISEYNQLPRFVQFKETKLESFEFLRSQSKSVARKLLVSGLMERAVLRGKADIMNSFDDYINNFIEISKKFNWQKKVVSA